MSRQTVNANYQDQGLIQNSWLLIHIAIYKFNYKFNIVIKKKDFQTVDKDCWDQE